MGRFEGKVALVTGSTLGLGEAIARRFVSEALAGLIVTGRDVKRGTAVARSLGSKTSVEFVATDLGDVDQVGALIDRTDERFGRLDILVNAAGISTRGSIEDTTPELFDNLMAVNVRAPLLLMQGAIRIMRREGIEGTIVNIGSVASHRGEPFLTPYATSKGALTTLTKNVAHSVLWDRIRCNILNLGWMDTPTEDVIQRTYHSHGKNWLGEARASQPFGRLLDPDEVARAVAFLASDDSGLMTGSVIEFNQGVLGGSAPDLPKRTSAAQ